MTTRPVVVVGNVGLDVITRPHGPIGWASDTPSAGALIEHVDPTASGDASDAGLLSVWLGGRNRMRALRAGIEVGSTAWLGGGGRHTGVCRWAQKVSRGW